MTQVIVRYRVHPERVGENEELVRDELSEVGSFRLFGALPS